MKRRAFVKNLLGITAIPLLPKALQAEPTSNIRHWTHVKPVNSEKYQQIMNGEHRPRYIGQWGESPAMTAIKGIKGKNYLMAEEMAKAMRSRFDDIAIKSISK